MEKRLPLAGVRVADFSWLIAGPYATMLMAQLGAEVIKVESQSRPDDVRLTMPYKDDIQGINRSVFWAMNNASKRSLSIDMNKPQGPALAKRLIAVSDIVVENFRPGQMERWGLGYEDLKKVKPDIIMLRISVHGQDGPYARQPLVGIFFQGATGFHNLVGWPDRDPAGIPSAYTDFVAPWFVAMGALGGLEYRRRTGQGLQFDVNQIESSPHFLAPAILDYAANGRVAERRGNSHPEAAPHGIYRCEGDDRWCAIAVHGDAPWQGLCRALGKEELASDSRYATIEARRARADELERVIEAWTTQRAPQEAVALLQKEGVPSAVVSSAEDILERDPQLKARGTFKEVVHPEVGAYRVAEVPFKLSKGRVDVRSAPTLGRDTEYVCCKILGLPDDEFANLVAQGVLK